MEEEEEEEEEKEQKEESIDADEGRYCTLYCKHTTP